MTKEEKLVVIDSLAEQLQAYPHFYIADIESLNAEQTAARPKDCGPREDARIEKQLISQTRIKNKLISLQLWQT